jgi:hypothetical protein
MVPLRLFTLRLAAARVICAVLTWPVLRLWVCLTLPGGLCYKWILSPLNGTVHITMPHYKL